MSRQEDFEKAADDYVEGEPDGAQKIVGQVEFERIKDEMWDYGYETAKKEFGWHPVSELPIVPKDEDKVEVYCLVHGIGLTILVPMKLHYTVSRGFGVRENIIVKWWCYPPKEE